MPAERVHRGHVARELPLERAPHLLEQAGHRRRHGGDALGGRLHRGHPIAARAPDARPRCRRSTPRTPRPRPCGGRRRRPRRLRWCLPSTR
ncbi:MAG: hypothetical protein ACK55I_13580, partial [bacterium]